jgi:hypothetical protein
VPGRHTGDRPGVVTAAGIATIVGAAGMVAAVTPTLYTERLIDTYREIYAGTSAEAGTLAMSATPYYVVGAAVLAAAVVLTVAGLAALAGKRLARALVWVLGALAVCSSVPVLLFDPDPPQRPPGAPPRPVVERMLDEAVPAWVDAVSYSGTALVMVSLLLAMALFGTPRANDYFRPPAPVVGMPPPLAG